MDAVSWTLIDTLATALGAGKNTRLKWRQRGVSLPWRIKIVEHAETLGLRHVTFKALAELPRSQSREASRAA